MSDTWADEQFDKLEAAYNEVPIEAKARISELEAALNEVADKWAQAQIMAEDYAKQNMLLKLLVRDLYECGKYECGNKCPHHRQGNKFCEFGAAGWLNERIKALGIEV